MSGAGFLAEPAVTEQVQQLFDDDIDELGYVMNVSRLWGHDVPLVEALFAMLRTINSNLHLSVRERGVLTTACASTLGDAYCSLQWGWKLADASDAETAAAVLRGIDRDLTPREEAIARWARAVAADPNATTAADLRNLRDVGFADQEILQLTCFVALRLAFSTVNDALGVRPDAQLRSRAPGAVLAAVDFGRPIAEAS